MEARTAFGVVRFCARESRPRPSVSYLGLLDDIRGREGFSVPDRSEDGDEYRYLLVEVRADGGWDVSWDDWDEALPADRFYESVF